MSYASITLRNRELVALLLLFFYEYSKTCIKGPLKNIKNKYLNENGSLKVESNAESIL